MAELGYTLELVDLPDGKHSMRYLRIKPGPPPAAGEFDKLIEAMREHKADIVIHLLDYRVLDTALALYGSTGDPKPYALACIDLHQPFYKDGLANIGPVGWEQWAGIESDW
jgi:hypothetical protein